ncbi:transcription elongation factor spt5 [Ascochyta rabiei]|uniref:Oxidoreductase n=1 Tax=Didymella rabiei TaxID=5454 RepID=A0A162XV46_DIDRA|nr:transcription elongation factor spt5 [Ascochyta rabiei]KZM19697.1 oxidoreductase [Ascochyta rabiei]UPX13804.1 transcription elongation factor spt5 [Ascochyta rabiei]
MKAILVDRFMTDVASVQPRNVATPEPRPPKQLHIKITHAAVTHVDILYAQGLHQNNKRHVQPPFILGTEFSGIVTAAPRTSLFKPGARVLGGGLGSFAEEICVDEASVRLVPDQWTNAEACAVGASGAVSYGALVSVAQVKAGETVLVLGASGGLGVMAIQIAKALGAQVIAVVGDAEKGEVVKRIGADAAVNYHDAKWEEKVKDLTPGKQGVEVVYDAIGAVESGIQCLKYRGRLVVVGFAARGGKMESIRANRILLKSAMVHGYRFGEDGRHDPQRTKDVWDGFMRLADDGKIQPVIYKEDYWGLEAVSRALADAQKRKAWGRAVVRINEEAEKELQKRKARL